MMAAPFCFEENPTMENLDMLTLPDIVGFMGVGLILIAYFWQQTKGVGATDWLHPVINALGSVLMLVSLIYKPNMPSIFIQLSWIAISALGFARTIRARQAAKQANSDATTS